MAEKGETHIDQYYIDGLAEEKHPIIDEIYEKYADQVKYWILNNNGSPADAGDVFQNALLAIFRQAKERELRITCPFGAYLMAIVKNQWYKELRKRGRKGVTKSIDEVYDVGTDNFREAEKAADQIEKEKLVFRFYKKLGDRCREIIRLSMKDRWSQSELADKLGISYGYLRKKKSQCMKKLIEMIHTSGFKF